MVRPHNKDMVYHKSSSRGMVHLHRPTVHRLSKDMAHQHSKDMGHQHNKPLMAINNRHPMGHKIVVEGCHMIPFRKRENISKNSD